MSELPNHGFSDKWKESEADPGYMTQTITVGRITVEVLRPILSADERAKREKQIMSSIARTMAPHMRKERGESA